MAARASSPALMRQLGGRIAALRQELGITQEKFAWTIGYDKAAMSLVESGQRAPSLAVMRIIARGLGVEIGDLFTWSQRRPRLRLFEATRRNDLAAAQLALDALKAKPMIRVPPAAVLHAAETTTQKRSKRPKSPGRPRSGS